MSISFVGIFVFLFGLAVGSFLNVVILRIPKGESIRGRSRCVACQKALRWFELVPLVSYIVLRGKCRSCRTSVSLQYPLVELTTALLFSFIWFTYAPNWLLVTGYSLLVAFLIILFVQDLRFQILPDVITLPAIAIALLFAFINSNYSLLVTRYWLLAATIGGGFFFLQWSLSRGRWVGGGDIRLGALMGAILGWPHILLALFFAYVAGAFVSIVLLAMRRVTRKTQIPLGPFLTASTVVTLFWGKHVIAWYADIIGL